MIRETMLSLAASRERPDRASIEELVRTYLRTLDTGDIEGRLALFAPDASFEDPVGTPAIVGHAALRAFWAGGSGLEVETRLEMLAITGNEAAYVFTARLLAGADDRVTIRVIELLTVDAKGLISTMRAYFDRHTIE